MAKSKEGKEPKAAPVKKAAPLTPEQIAKLPPAAGGWLKPGQVEPEVGRYLVEDAFGMYGVATWNGGWFYRALVREVTFFKRMARVIE
jgi:hypothetical protein